MPSDVHEYFGDLLAGLSHREVTWVEYLQLTLSDIEGELGPEATLHIFLLILLRHMQRLHPVFTAGWRSVEAADQHLDAIRYLASEVAAAGEAFPPSGSLPRPENGEQHGGT